MPSSPNLTSPCPSTSRSSPPTTPQTSRAKPSTPSSMLPPSITSTAPNPPLPLPTILNIHGGPHSAYGWVFDHEMLLMAAKGYAVIYPNPRGSTTYGQNFANIIMNNYPGDDFHDLMDTVDVRHQGRHRRPRTPRRHRRLRRRPPHRLGCHPDQLASKPP